ncbi:Rv1679 family acyl-CoA dehydrogenase [Mycolicibacterium vanbaalenii]|uniref:Acyl-CoA dehydrogenase domain protein n=1 Tax=Mycolicibacterium vanbaalenii (strain DSM 7251 / JCM 13017 / BCRC 16820 / KCTC 9966 / NRRL B-24157 / PYR-1) TaxID=350058 RepID=A1THK0_MYCVP|nr:acyl-CoA dehydrogenase family protein [Mycolicibacterium vanbaalenii]ABM16650.1 acyl-CoA dehydrogenase domain protein [Mycolicibacterium vanbaalenii PYR-1]MCV7130958.1 acyl-CoA/acyl-ACP dehydrogenase [Mycolicibacterium vanbaalenii PYR-1]
MYSTEALNHVISVAAASADQVDAEGAYPAAAVDALRGSGLLGLVVPEEAGGLGAGPQQFVDVVGGLAAACGSTAMVYLMHTAAAVTVAAAPPPGMPEMLSAMASGNALGTLAFSEKGSRSHFWAPVSTAALSDDGDTVKLRADKSWVTSAGYADIYIVSAGSTSGVAGEVDLYALPRSGEGLSVVAPFAGMGLRGNASSPMTVDATIPVASRLGAQAAGFGLLMETVLPWFNLGNAAVSLGLAGSAYVATIGHVSGARLEHRDEALSALPTIRAQIAKMGTTLAAQRAYLRSAAASVSAPDEETLNHVLGIKASANDAALTITESAMRVCGGAAFSKHLPIERNFRDARAGAVMAPTADVLYDFYGKAVTGLPLF